MYFNKYTKIFQKYLLYNFLYVIRILFLDLITICSLCETAENKFLLNKLRKDAMYNEQKFKKCAMID